MERKRKMQVEWLGSIDPDPVLKDGEWHGTGKLSQ